MVRVRTSTKAAVLLVLFSLQSSFAAQQLLDVALCSTALCYPKGSGSKYGKIAKSCPAGYTLETDAAGKDICAKRIAVPCPSGTTLKDGKCCGSSSAKSCLLNKPGAGSSCPDGFKAMRDCGSFGSAPAAVDEPAAANATEAAEPAEGEEVEVEVEGEVAEGKPSRHLLAGGGALVKELNILGTQYVPNIILPKPAFSVTIAPPKATKPSKINLPSNQMPQIILPKPKVSFNLPELPKVGPSIKFEGNPDIMPRIIPILPEPLVTVEMPKLPNLGPKVHADLTTKTVTLDLSKVGPKHTVDLNLPAMPNIIGEVAKLPDVDIFVPDGPKVLDFTSLGPKKIYEITLPKVKLPKQGSLTVVNAGSNEPQYIDLTGLGPKNVTGVNIKLPEVKTNGAVVNVIMEENKAMPEKIVLPGNGGLHNTVINVPEKAWPEKKSSLVVDVQANPKLKAQGIFGLGGDDNSTKATNITTVSIKMPELDLSKAHSDLPDVLVELKPLMVFNKSQSTKPKTTEVKRVTVQMKPVEIPRLMNDTTFLIKPVPINVTHLLPHKLFEVKEDRTNATSVTINMPNNTLPTLPTPKGKIDTAINLPLKFGLVKNSSDPDATVKLIYREEWVNGNPVLPNPTAAVLNKVGKFANALGEAQCPTKCCKEVVTEGCTEQEVRVETRPPMVDCEAGCAYEAGVDACVCAKPDVHACPAGMTKCSLHGKGVCVPKVEGLSDVCHAFKAICIKGSIFAKTCPA